jgi:hypothetical protein
MTLQLTAELLFSTTRLRILPEQGPGDLPRHNTPGGVGVEQCTGDFPTITIVKSLRPAYSDRCSEHLKGGQS